MGQLILLAALGILTGPARPGRAADLPYEGSWKITFLNVNQALEIDLWLVKIDKEGKKAELLSALPDPFIKDNKIAVFKATAGSLQIDFKGTRNNELFVRAYPAKGKNKTDPMLGAVRINYDFTPIRIEKPEATTINPMTAVRPMAGKADLEAAIKTTDVEDKIKDLEDIIKTYDGKPIVFITSQVLLQELVKKKAAADSFKSVAEGYVKSVASFGREMQLQANLNLSRNLINYDPTKAQALKYSEQAFKLMVDDDNRGVKLQVLIALANAQHKNGKEDAVKETLAKITPICEDVIKKPRFAATPLAPTQEMGRWLLASTAPLVADAGLEYARRAVKMIKDDTPVDQKLGAYKLLQAGLQARGKADEARSVAAIIDKMETDLDKKYLETAIPFKPEKYAGRKGKSDRVVVVEMFTNVQAPSCRAPELAFDALSKTYSPKEVALIQYHMHLPPRPGSPPGPDPLANTDSEARAKFYADDLEGAPTLFVDGKVTDPMAGADNTHIKARFDSLRKLVDDALPTAAGAQLKLKVTRTGEKIDIAGDVSDLKEPGAKVKLRFVLVEETVRFPGNNGLRLHHNVVRALPGGPAGFALDKKASAHKASITLGEVRKKVLRFPNMEVPQELKKLKVIALIQDDDSKKVYQAAQADVPEAKEDKAKEGKTE
jgi:hypothetical protein